ncbi:MAG TPA: phosphotransferase [Tepidiformaceae bacterium]|nr:phosphotransferase [Tepidiformaceae bacterium]
MLASVPQPIAAHLRAAHGEPVAVTRLGGMSLARVFRLDFAAASLVLKASPSPVESTFYEDVAPGLREAGVPIPAVESVFRLGREHWVAMEYFPHALPPPPDPWAPDPYVVGALVRLHAVTRGANYDLPFRPAAWTPHVTVDALSCLPTCAAIALEPQLTHLQRRANPSGPWSWVSGDPSPPNWGRRDDGSVALFDWELFRPGVPAHDLAPAVPGLARPPAFSAMALAYAAAAASQGITLPWTPGDLARDTVIAKIATVMVLLAAHARATARVPQDYVDDVVRRFPEWFGEVAASYALHTSLMA